jgi:phosphohistidine phosphatase
VATAQRQLVILRHAKSAWPDGVPDRQRPLARRGRRDAPAAGRWLRDHVEHLNAVVCSPAERARQTWALVAGELDNPPAAKFDDHIYGAPPGALLTVVRELPDTAGTALLVGHNPGVQELVALLSGREPAMKTSSVAVLTWTGSWVDADVDAALLRHHATPRG